MSTTNVLGGILQGLAGGYVEEKERAHKEKTDKETVQLRALVALVGSGELDPDQSDMVFGLLREQFSKSGGDKERIPFVLDQIKLGMKQPARQPQRSPVQAQPREQPLGVPSHFRSVSGPPPGQPAPVQVPSITPPGIPQPQEISREARAAEIAGFPTPDLSDRVLMWRLGRNPIWNFAMRQAMEEEVQTRQRGIIAEEKEAAAEAQTERFREIITESIEKGWSPGKRAVELEAAGATGPTARLRAGVEEEPKFGKPETLKLRGESKERLGEEVLGIWMPEIGLYRLMGSEETIPANDVVPPQRTSDLLAGLQRQQAEMRLSLMQFELRNLKVQVPPAEQRKINLLLSAMAWRSTQLRNLKNRLAATSLPSKREQLEKKREAIENEFRNRIRVARVEDLFDSYFQEGSEEIFQEFRPITP